MPADHGPSSKSYFPLGVPIRLTANAETVHAAAEEAWGGWKPLLAVEPVEVAVEALPAVAVEKRAVVFEGRPEGFRFTLDASNFADATWEERRVAIRLAESIVEDRPFFLYYFLEAAVNQLLAGLYFTPVHGACAAPASREAILLCGDSGAGKSSLVFACARRGWTFTSDDASFLVNEGGGRVVGDAHRLRMRPESVRLFPELAAHAPSRRGNGDVRLQMPVADLGFRRSPSAAVARAVFLQRDDSGRAARLAVWDRRVAAEWFRRVFYHWAPAIAGEQERSLSSLLDRVRLEVLTYSRIDDAVQALEG